MSHRILQELQLEHERILWELASGENRAKLLVRLIDIDEQLERFPTLAIKESGQFTTLKKKHELN
ncbi:MAG: hypothetical protein ACRKFN_07080 [Desulfitobacterium sp.]